LNYLLGKHSTIDFKPFYKGSTSDILSIFSLATVCKFEIWYKSVSKCKFIYSGIILGTLVSFWISYLIDDLGDVLNIELIYEYYFLYSFYEN